MYENLQVDMRCSEINSLTNAKNKQNTEKKSKCVEIFTAMTNGDYLNKYSNEEVNKCLDTIKTWGNMALNGNFEQQQKAIAEINSVTTLAIQAPLTQRLSLVASMGNERTVGYDERLEVEVYEMQGEKSRNQAASGAVVFPTVNKRTKSLDTKTVSGGMAIDYREYASGSIDAITYAKEEVLTDMTNRYVVANYEFLIDAIKNAKGLKSVDEGIEQKNIDAMIKKLRKFGAGISILGDYDLISEFNGMAGFDVTPLNSGKRTQWQYSEATMNEILKTGLLSNYNGTALVTIPNTYDLTSLNDTKDFYKTYLPETGLLFVPNGSKSPLMICRRGGLTTMMGDDINTRQHITRFDIEYGNFIVDQYIPMTGLITPQA